MDKEMFDKLDGLCKLCRKTGADDSQYILVPIAAVEELLKYVSEVENEQEKSSREKPEDRQTD